MECPPLYVQVGSTRGIVHDDAWVELEAARKKYRADYNRGYSLSERGEDMKAQAILDKANADLNAAEQRYLDRRAAA